MTRAEKIQAACELRSYGLALDDIADHFGVGRTTVVRWLARGGEPQAEVATRFFAKVALSRGSDCWLWMGCIDGGGYGRFARGGGTGHVAAHRWAWEFCNGTEIPEGLEIDHLCRTRACVNPDHLEPVTSRENVRRGIAPAAANARKTHCPRGHPYAGDNLSIGPGGRRRCRTCQRDYGRRAYAAKWDPDKKAPNGKRGVEL